MGGIPICKFLAIEVARRHDNRDGHNENQSKGSKDNKNAMSHYYCDTMYHGFMHHESHEVKQRDCATVAAAVHALFAGPGNRLHAFTARVFTRPHSPRHVAREQLREG